MSNYFHLKMYFKSRFACLLKWCELKKSENITQNCFLDAYIFILYLKKYTILHHKLHESFSGLTSNILDCTAHEINRGITEILKIVR